MHFGISAVLLVGAVIEMIGVATFAIAAFVQNHPRGFAIEQSVGSSVSSLNAAQAPVSIARSSAAAYPLPAVAGVANPHFAAEIFPRASSPYDVPHQLKSVSWSRSRGGNPLGHPNLTFNNRVLLPDFEIRRLCQQKAMVNPFIEEHLNPASLDVAIGDRIMVEQEDSPELQIVGLHEYSKQDPFLIYPGEWFLAETREIFNLPDHIGAQFVLKSSRAREGWDHAEAGWADPGWNGSRLTMELKNNRQHHPLPLWPGLRIGQMKFIMLAGCPDRTYAQSGRYNADLSVTASKG